MKDSSNLIDTDRKDSKIIFEARVFCFPFTEVKLSLNTLKELQTPIGARLADIILFL